MVAFVATWPPIEAMHHCYHIVDFFAAEETFVQRVAAFMRDGFESGCACIAIVTPAHRVAINDALALRGFDGDELIAEYRYIVLDAEATLDAIRRDGRFDVAEFHRTLGQLITLAAAGGKQLRIVGEVVSLLAERGEHLAAIELEELWNDLSREYPFTLYCAYRSESMDSADLRQKVRALHNGLAEEVV
jgi:hypothetical protein